MSVWVSSRPLALVHVSVHCYVSSKAMSCIIKPIAFVVRTVFPYLFSTTTSQIVLPLALVCNFFIEFQGALIGCIIFFEFRSAVLERWQFCQLFPRNFIQVIRKTIFFVPVNLPCAHYQALLFRIWPHMIRKTEISFVFFVVR